ncbi:MFS transporter [Streptomyces sp. URMC 123]|uniref:MFS transporter n=1 Tax=Streptomyces sp. URMC 123 TaxID=3423403 RepID=UPI003F195D58
MSAASTAPVPSAPSATGATASGPSTSAGSAAPPRPVPVLWLALLATPFAAGANSPVLILPGMARSLNVDVAAVTWLVTAFAWATAIGTPLMAALLRHRGLAGTLRASSALLLAGTAVLAAAPWLPLALLGRAAQALGGAGLVAAAIALAGTVGRMGVITAGFGVMGATGPLLGSLLGGATSWRVALSISLVSLVAVPAVLRAAPTTAAPAAGAGRFDSRGAGLLTALVTALVLLPRHPLPAVLAALVAAGFLAAHVRGRPEGFVPVEVVRSRAFKSSALLACALSTSYFALLFALPRLLQDRTDWSTTAIGAGQLVALLVGSALSWLFSAASPRMGRRTVLAVLVAAGALAPVLTLIDPWPPLLLLVATLGVFATTAGNAVLSVRAASAAADRRRPTALGLFTLCYQLGGAFGPAITALVALA